MTPDADLDDLPNVGPTLAAELRAAGIVSVHQLRTLGARSAWARLRDVNRERDCASSLLALEGALRGVRWMAMDRAERDRIRAYAEEQRAR
jgi:DNA transformation protein